MMRKLIFGLLLSVLCFSGVLAQETTPEATPESGERIFMHDGLERNYVLHVPAGYDSAQPAPLMLILHPSGATGVMMQSFLNFNELADESGHILAYPDGIDGFWDYLDIPVGREEVIDDLGFLTALIDSLSAEFNVDPNRLYVMGFSNGGLMTYRMACELSDRLAGAAVIAANLTFRLAEGCTDDALIPLIQVLGMQDDTFPWLGYVEVEDGRMYSALSIAQTTSFFSTLGQCDRTPNPVDITHESSPVRVVSQTYGNCANGAEFILYGLVEFAHNWPDTPVIYLADGSSGRIIESVWEFFGRHTKE